MASAVRDMTNNSDNLATRSTILLSLSLKHIAGIPPLMSPSCLTLTYPGAPTYLKGPKSVNQWCVPPEHPVS